MQKGCWTTLHLISDKKIWLVGLHMISQDVMIIFGGQAISDNNFKFAQIMKYNITTNKLAFKSQ